MEVNTKLSNASKLKKQRARDLKPKPATEHILVSCIVICGLSTKLIQNIPDEFGALYN